MTSSFYLSHTYSKTLPDPVLIKIFSHLSGQDLLTASKVCSNWNRILEIAPHLLDKICLVFNEISITSEHPYLNVFLNSNRKYTNIKFQSVKLVDPCHICEPKCPLKHNLALWKQLGANVKNCEIIRCRIELLTVLKLMRLCSKLETFVIDKMVWMTYNNKTHMRHVIKSLPSAFTYLRTFSIHLSTISCEFMKKLIMCMPHLENIIICSCCCCYTLASDVHDIDKMSTMNYIIWSYFLISVQTYKTPLKCIEYHGELNKNVFEDLNKSALLLREFKYVNCSDDEKTLSSSVLEAFCSIHSELEILNLINFTISDANIKVIANRLLKLKELRLSNNNFTPNVVTALNKLGYLQVLQLGQVDVNLDTISISDLSYLNLAIRSSEIIISDISIKYKCLLHLEIDSSSSLSDKSVKLILSNFLKLQVLKLHNISDVSESVFSDIKRFNSLRGSTSSSSTKSSLLRLQDLRVLELNKSTKLSDLTLARISKLKNLRKLLVCCPRATKHGFDALARQSRSIDELKIVACDNLDIKIIEHLIRDLKNLKNLQLIQCTSPMSFDVQFLLKNMKRVTWKGYNSRPRRTATLIMRALNEN